jgi:hypothetical protein
LPKRIPGQSQGTGVVEVQPIGECVCFSEVVGIDPRKFGHIGIDGRKHFGEPGYTLLLDLAENPRQW